MNKFNNIQLKHKAKYNLSPVFFITITLWLCFVWLIFTASAASVTTNAPTSVSTNGATFNGVITNLSTPSASVWFEYSGVQSDFMFKTPTQTITSNSSFTSTISGVPLLTNQRFYVRAGMDDGTGAIYGGVQNFTTSPALTAIPYNFNAHFNELIQDKMNITAMAITVPKVYTDIFGAIFYGIMFGMVFVLIWMRQEDVTLPALLGLLIGGSLWAYLPPDWVAVGYSLTIVSFAGLMYSLIHKP